MLATVLHQTSTKSSSNQDSSRSDSLNPSASLSPSVEPQFYGNDSTDNKSPMSDDGSSDFKPKARSRMGCFTCRKRKKRCDERKPVCQACVRLKLECQYPLPGQERKNRKRKSSVDGTQEDAELLVGLRQGLSENDNIITDSLTAGPSLFPTKATSTASANRSQSSKKLKPQASAAKTPNLIKGKFVRPVEDKFPKSDVAHSSPLSINRRSQVDQKAPLGSSQDFLSHLDPYLDTSGPNYQTSLSQKPVSGANVPQRSSASGLDPNHTSSNSAIQVDNGLSPFSEVSPPTACSCSHICNHQQHHHNNNSHHHHHHHRYISKGPQENGSIEEIAGDSRGTYQLPTDLYSQSDPEVLDKLNIIFKQSPDPGIISPSSVFARGLHSLLASPKPEQGRRITEIENDEIDEKEINSGDSIPCDVLQKSPMSFFDANLVDSNGLNFNSPPNFYGSSHEQYFMDSPGRDFSVPPILTSPTPWYALQLDKFGVDMFDYYTTRLADMICVSSGNFNSFLDVFVPMAHQDPAVLYALVAYGAFHNDMGKYEEAGMRYLNKAIEMVREDLSKHKLTTLACILIIVTAEICRGDMIHWDKHLEAAAAVIKMNGGLQSFVGDKTKRWLASNFFYHEILGASRSSRKTHFLAIEYDELLRSDIGVHSLIGCCKSIFHLMAQLSDLAVESQAIFEKLEDNDETSELFYSSELRNLLTRAKALEDKIDNCRPDPIDIVSLSAEDQEEQLTLFDTFQITAKLQLQQSTLRRNAASLNMQVLAADLVESLDVVLNTKVEGLLVFPLFMASIMATRPHTRMAMLDRFDRFYKRNLARNIVRAQSLAEQVWSEDCNGTKYVNWSALIQSHGMDICFA